MKITPLESALFHAEGQTDMAKLSLLGRQLTFSLNKRRKCFEGLNISFLIGILFRGASEIK